MNKNIDDIVTRILATRIRSSFPLRRWQRLREDLGVMPLDLVLVVLEAEDASGLALRIEDLAAVTDDGVEIMTSFPKTLIEVS